MSGIPRLRGGDCNRPLIPTAEQVLCEDPKGGQQFWFGAAAAPRTIADR